jgi:hypothetical protein
LAAQGFIAAQGFLAPHGFFAAQGFLPAQGFFISCCIFFFGAQGLHGLRSAKTGPLKENAIRPAVMEAVKILRRVLIINSPEIC